MLTIMQASDWLKIRGKAYLNVPHSDAKPLALWGLIVESTETEYLEV